MLQQIMKTGTETQIYAMLNQSCERRRCAEVKDKVYKHSHKTAWGSKRQGMTAYSTVKNEGEFGVYLL
jgi:hypothetical protein